MANSPNNGKISLQLFTFTGFMLIILIAGCRPAEQKGDEKSGADSTEIATKRTTEKYESRGRGVEDSVIAQFIRKYPEMQYAYLPTDEGKIITVKGNFQVAVDGIKDQADLNKFVRYLEQNFENRAMLRDEYNKNIEVPAKPKGGYEAYYNMLEQNLEYPDEVRKGSVERIVFVEFIVNEEGQLTGVEAVENSYYGPDNALISRMRAAAVEAIRSTSWKWLPARRGNESVKMKIELPVHFHLARE